MYLTAQGHVSHHKRRIRRTCSAFLRYFCLQRPIMKSNMAGTSNRLSALRSEAWASEARSGPRLRFDGRLSKAPDIEHSRSAAWSTEPLGDTGTLTLGSDLLLLFALQSLFQALRDSEGEKALLRIEFRGFPFPEQLLWRLVKDLTDTDTWWELSRTQQWKPSKVNGHSASSASSFSTEAPNFSMSSARICVSSITIAWKRAGPDGRVVKDASRSGD
jgi:hypothetical protein